LGVLGREKYRGEGVEKNRTKIFKKNKFRVPAWWRRRTGRPTTARTTTYRRRNLACLEEHVGVLKRENRVKEREERERKGKNEEKGSHQP